MTKLIVALIATVFLAAGCKTRTNGGGGAAAKPPLVISPLADEPGGSLLASVDSVSALLRQPARRVGGWDMRLGIADPGNTLGPIVLVYCLADRVDATAPLPDAAEIVDGEPLGPFGVRATIGCPTPEATRLAMADRIVRLAGEKKPNRVLYVAALPVTLTGTYAVRVRQAGDVKIEDSVVAAARVAVVDPIARPWAAVADRTIKRQRHEGPPHATITPIAYAAGVAFDGKTPIALTPEDNALPGLNVDTVPVRVTLDGDAFVLEAPRDVFDRRAEDRLLAQWTVNGRSVDPPYDKFQRAQAMMMISEWLLPPVARLRVTVGLPEFLGPLRAGDEVGVRFLYSPRPIVRLDPSNASLQTQQLSELPCVGSPVPLRTARLDFRVTDAMIATRNATAAATQPTSLE